MSDHIDELVNDLTEETWNLYSLAGGAEFRDAQISHDDILATIRDLSTIAREAEARALKAEAMCEWLAEALADNGWCRQDPEGPCRDDGEDCPKCALAAAREAVK